MRSLHDAFPDANAVLDMEPEELAGVLLDLFISAEKEAEKRRERPSRLQSHELGLPEWVKDYPRESQSAISHALMEAWLWLENNGFLAPVPGGTDRQYGESFLTRRAYEWNSSTRLVEFICSTHLQRDALHPRVAEKAWPNYIRGEFETAVFQAFRQVEISVREAGGYDASKYGVDLMREAFHVAHGPLSDGSALKSEREAMSALFAGALGLFKNPSSHREVNYDDPAVAAEAIAFASLLLRLVDARREVSK
ncbi:MAG TPA: TIGR02391 family protein [Thermoanaerobaculia bacterium]|jgi:uncharacterized protein (TIGR02391 family)